MINLFGLWLLACATALVVELRESDYNAFRAKCVEANSVCIVRNWAEQYPAMRDTFSFENLKRVCGDEIVDTSRYERASRQFAKLVDGKSYFMRGLIEKIQGGSQLDDMVFDESVPTLCLETLRNYTVPFMAANDYIHHTVTGNCNWFSGRNCEQALEDSCGFVPFTDHPSIFLQAKGTQCGVHVDAYHSHFLQVLHVGEKQWVIGPSESSSSIVLGDSDLIFVPAGTPHYVVNLRASVATSINFIDGTNWQKARGKLLGHVSPKLLADIDLVHQRFGHNTHNPTSVSWQAWIAGHQRDRIAMPTKEGKDDRREDL